jgi:hypothetical protein
MINLTTSETKPILENYRPISTLALSHGEFVMMDAEDNIFIHLAASPVNK